MPQLEREGTRLHYEVDGSGPAVLLVHGLGLDVRMWDSQVRQLAKVARVVRPDLRGFGRSPRESGVAYSHTADLVALLDALRIDQVDLVGQSMGGMVAMELVRAAPQRVRSLMLIDSVVDGVPFDHEAALTFRRLREAVEEAGVPAARTVWLESAFFAPARRDPVLAGLLARMVGDYSGLDWLGDDPHESREPLLAWVEQIAVPTTVVVGELDVASFLEMGEQLADRIPGARLVTLPDVGHMANMEAPEVVNQLLLDQVSRT